MKKGRKKYCKDCCKYAGVCYKCGGTRWDPKKNHSCSKCYHWNNFHLKYIQVWIYVLNFLYMLIKYTI